MKRKVQVEVDINQPLNVIHNGEKVTLVAKIDTYATKCDCCDACWFENNGIECDNYVCDMYNRHDKTSIYFDKI